jgi:hypothetical protein
MRWKQVAQQMVFAHKGGWQPATHAEEWEDGGGGSGPEVDVTKRDFRRPNTEKIGNAENAEDDGNRSRDLSWSPGQDGASRGEEGGGVGEGVRNGGGKGGGSTEGEVLDILKTLLGKMCSLEARQVVVSRPRHRSPPSYVETLTGENVFLVGKTILARV